MSTLSAPIAARRAPSPAVRRWVGILLIVLVGAVVVANVFQQAADPTAAFGSDWWWYLDGPARMFAGRPLFDPSMLAGPYAQLSPAFLFLWNQAPTAVVPIGLFAVIVPTGLQFAAWSALMVACVVGAFATVWPKGLSLAGTALLAVIIAVLPPILWGWYWANASCVVALGAGLVICGERRGSDRLMALGLILAGAAKVIPAAPLAIWLLVRKRRWRPVALALIGAVALMVPVVAAQGPSVLIDFLTVTRNATEAASGSNVAPLAYLTIVFGHTVAGVLCYGGAVLLGFVALRQRSDLTMLMLLVLATDLVVPNLWIHWLITPIVVGVAMLGRGSIRRLEMVAGSPIEAPSSL